MAKLVQVTAAMLRPLGLLVWAVLLAAGVEDPPPLDSQVEDFLPHGIHIDNRQHAIDAGLLPRGWLSASTGANRTTHPSAGVGARRGAPPHFRWLTVEPTRRHHHSTHPVLVTLLVCSAAGNSHRRAAIRATWASLGRVHDRGIEVIFYIAADSGNQTLSLLLANESRIHGDTALWTWTPANVGWRQQASALITWLVARQQAAATDYLVVVRDDTLVDVFHLVEFLSALNAQDRLLLCQVSVKKSRATCQPDGIFVVSQTSLVSLVAEWKSSVDPERFILDPDRSVAERLGIMKSSLPEHHGVTFLVPSSVLAVNRLDKVFFQFERERFLDIDFRRLWNTILREFLQGPIT